MWVQEGPQPAAFPLSGALGMGTGPSLLCPPIEQSCIGQQVLGQERGNTERQSCPWWHRVRDRHLGL